MVVASPVSLRRNLFALAGVGALAAAFTAPGRVEERIGRLVTAAGNDYVLVGAIAVLGILVGLMAVVSGRIENLRQAELPEPEDTVHGGRPGASVDAALATPWLSLPILGHAKRAFIRDRVRQAAVASLMRANGCPRSQATRLIERGEWTEERSAAMFLTTGDATTSRPIADMLRWEPLFARRARHAIAAIENARVERAPPTANPPGADPRPPGVAHGTIDGRHRPGA